MFPAYQNKGAENDGKDFYNYEWYSPGYVLHLQTYSRLQGLGMDGSIVKYWYFKPSAPF